MTEIDEYRPAGRRRLGDRHGNVQADAGNLLTRCENPAVSDHCHCRLRQQIVPYQQLRQQFGADAGRIAHGDGDARDVSICHFPLPNAEFQEIAYCIQSVAWAISSLEVPTPPLKNQDPKGGNIR